MNSSSDLHELPRSRVIRGAANTRLRSIPFTENLDGDRLALGLDPVAVERTLEAGRQAGFEQGYAAGLAAAAASVAEGEARRRAEVDRAVSALTTAAIAFHQRQAEALSSTDDELAEAAIQIAAAVIDREVATAVDPGADAIARALALAPEGDPVVRLNPADVAALGTIECGRDLTVVPDPTIEPGGCLLEVGACRIDAQLSTALQRVREALR